MCTKAHNYMYADNHTVAHVHGVYMISCTWCVHDMYKHTHLIGCPCTCSLEVQPIPVVGPDLKGAGEMEAQLLNSHHIKQRVSERRCGRRVTREATNLRASLLVHWSAGLSSAPPPPVEGNRPQAPPPRHWTPTGHPWGYPLIHP